MFISFSDSKFHKRTEDEAVREFPGDRGRVAIIMIAGAAVVKLGRVSCYNFGAIDVGS